MDTNEIKVEWAEEREKESAAAAPESKDRQYETRRENGRTYLVRICSPAYEDEERILTEGWTEGLLRAAASSCNGEDRCLYDITGKQSLLYECEKTEADFDKLRSILLDVGSCLEKLTEYLLREDGIVFDPACIFTGIDGKERLFLYDPSQEGTFALHIREFAEFLAQKVDYRDEKAVELAGRFCQYTGGENFSMKVFFEENRQYFEAEESGEICEAETEEADAGEIFEGNWEEQQRAFRVTGEETERGRRRMMIGIAAAVIVCAALRLSAIDAAAVISAGACAGIAAAVLYWYIGYEKRRLLKKETEVYRLMPEEDGRFSENGKAPALREEK